MSGQTLAERLGYRKEDRLLIVNCDDLGSSHSANVASFAAMRDGIATSATLMVPCPWAREAAELFAGRDVGIHLTLTCEYPGYRWRSLTAARSLHDAQGFMPATTAEVWKNADVGDVERECRAQIEQALAWDVDVTHLDAHMGTMQLEPRYFGLYVKLAADYDLPLSMVGPGQENRLGFACREPAAKEGLVFPDWFVSPWGKPTREVFRNALANLRPGVTEIYLHPVEDGPELRGYDKQHPEVRIGDRACLFDGELRRMIGENGVKPISFRALRDLQRARESAFAAVRTRAS